MGVYIPGIKLPKDEPGAFQVIVMYVGADGKLRAECEGTHEVVHVPAHGRLIDADAFIKENEYFADRDFNNPRYDTTLRELVGTAPTIIPAEEG